MTSIFLVLLMAFAQSERDKRDTPPPDSPAARSGSEIPWVTSLDEAVASAEAKQRLIAWYIPTVEKTPMDRKVVLENYMNMGPFMHSEVIALLTRRFVPLKRKASGDLAKLLGIRPIDFIEPGFVFMTKDLEVVHKIDRLTLYSGEFFDTLLRQVLRKYASSPVKRHGAPLEDYLDGELDRCVEACRSEGDRPLLARALLRLRRFTEAEKILQAEDAGFHALRSGKYEEACRKLAGAQREEGRYFLGVALHRLNRDAEGREVWKKLVAEKHDSRWAWKADAELRRFGPFVREFESPEYLPEGAAGELPTSTQKGLSDLETAAKRGVAFLLRSQRENGCWDDSNYDFGGLDSLPNVYMAVTALASRALLEWREIDREGVTRALSRSWNYLTNETHIARDDKDEIIWAHLYRLVYLSCLAEVQRDRRDEILSVLKRWVGFIAKLQEKSGIWYHEYPAPFTTASVLQALHRTRKAGVEVDPAMLKKGTEALKSCRGKKGVFSYDYPPKEDRVEGAAGRMPLCELALFLNGSSELSRVRSAIEASFEHHDRLERVRKYDMHADPYANGGFFFFYDLYGRAEAIRCLEGDVRKKYAERLRDQVLSIAEVDGAWVDSHELGRCYGTAMALSILKSVTSP